jgi:hypothetical protein
MWQKFEITIAEHALDRDDQVLAVGRDGREERLGRRRHIAVAGAPGAGRVEDAEVHRLHVKIDAAVKPVLSVVESQTLSSCAAVRIHLRQSLLSRVAGGGLNEYQRAAPDARRC